MASMGVILTSSGLFCSAWAGPVWPVSNDTANKRNRSGLGRGQGKLSCPEGFVVLNNKRVVVRVCARSARPSKRVGTIPTKTDVVQKCCKCCTAGYERECPGAPERLTWAVSVNDVHWMGMGSTAIRPSPRTPATRYRIKRCAVMSKRGRIKGGRRSSTVRDDARLIATFSLAKTAQGVCGNLGRPWEFGQVCEVTIWMSVNPPYTPE